MTDARDPALPTDLAAALAAAFAPRALAPGRRDALRARVLAAAQPGPMRVVRANEGDWHALLPGVAVKFLHLDAHTATQSSLWRLDPGAVVPGHPHDADEECVILEGVIRFGDAAYGRGDFLLARPGLDHEPFSAPDGALLYIRSGLSRPLEQLARRAGLIAAP